MATNIGIIGDGNVGGALARGLKRAGHEVRAVGKEPGAIRDVVGWGEVVIVAVPFGAIDNVVKTAGEALAGKTVIDVTNALDANGNLALGFTTSGAEELQKKLPKSRVVKAFNTVFAQHMDTGQLGDKPARRSVGLRPAVPIVTAFAAGDHANAKATVLQLARDIGFDAVDVVRSSTLGCSNRSASSTSSSVTNSRWARRSASSCSTGDTTMHTKLKVLISSLRARYVRSRSTASWRPAPPA